MARPSTRSTGAISPIVPVQNISSARYTSVSDRSFSRAGDAVPPAKLQHDAARDPLRTGRLRAGQHLAAVYHEDVRGVGFRHEAAHVEHQGVVGPSDVGLDFRQYRLDKVAMMDLGVEAVRREAADGAGDERDAAFIVNGVLELGEDDEGRPGRVEARVHAGGVLDAARQRQADVNAVGHAIGFEGAADLAEDLLMSRDDREGEGQGGIAETVEVFASA